jgi:tripartite-type tricarboxylate transporter receptor subunit TctC
VLELPEVREKMIAQGQTPIGNSPEEAAANQRADVAKWGALFKGFGIKID